LKTVKVFTSYWHDKRALDLKFPDQWGIKVYHMKGHDSPELSDLQIRRRLMDPIHSEDLHKLAAKRKEAVILFDDLTRPTPTFRIIPHILTELAKGGISPQHVRFVCASAAHGMSNRADFARKLGERVVERFPVYNHNPFHNLQDLGVTTRGTPVQINKEVMGCDLKIGIGGILPHSMAGFGGGGKIILPGVASIESICHNHCNIAGDCFERTSFIPFKSIEHNESRADINEAAKMAGLDFKIDTIINESGKISDLFAGDPIEEWKEGVEEGKRPQVKGLEG
jgi:nickel-dependent lactate racemase